MPGFTTTVRATIRERAQDRCELCGEPPGWDGFSIHHRRPRRMGGDKRPDTNTAANGLFLCGQGTTGCHGKVESDRIASMNDGLLLGYREDPTEVPVLLHRGLVRLDVHGQYLEVAA